MGKKNKKNKKRSDQPKNVEHENNRNNQEARDEQPTSTTNSQSEVAFKVEEGPDDDNIPHSDLPPLSQALVNMPPYVENTQLFSTNDVQDDHTSGAQNHNPMPASAQPPSYEETLRSIHQSAQHQPPPSIVHPPSYEEALQSLHQEDEGNTRHQHYLNPTPPPSLVHQPHFDYDAFNQATQERPEGARPKGTKPSWVRGQSAPIHDDETLADFDCINLPQNRYRDFLEPETSPDTNKFALPEPMMLRCYKQHMQLIKLNGNSQNISFNEWCSMYHSFFQYYHDNTQLIANMNYFKWLILNHDTLQEYMSNKVGQVSISEWCFDDFQWETPSQMEDAAYNEDDFDLMDEDGFAPQPQFDDGDGAATAYPEDDNERDNHGQIFPPANGGHGNNQAANFVPVHNLPQPAGAGGGENHADGHGSVTQTQQNETDNNATQVDYYTQFLQGETSSFSSSSELSDA